MLRPIPALRLEQFDKTFQRFIKNSSWIVLSNLFASSLTFIQSVLLARWLGADQFGLLTLVIVYVTLINSLIDFRVWETATRYITKFWAAQDEPRAIAVIKLSYWVDGLTGILGFGVVLLTANLISDWLVDTQDITPYIRLFAVAMLFATLNNTAQAVLRVFNAYIALAMSAISVAIFQLIFVIFLFATENLTIISIILSTIVTEFIRGCTLLFFARQASKQNFRGGSFDSPISLLSEYQSELLRFLGNTNLTALLQTVGGNIDILLLGLLTSNTQVGLYKVAKNFVALIARLSQPFFQAIYPELARLWANNERSAFRSLIGKTTILMTLIITPLVVGLTLFIPFAIRWSAGVEYLPAATGVRIMTVGMALNFIMLWLHPVALSSGKAHATNLALVCQAPIWLLGAIVLIPQMGFVGAAMMYTLATVTWVGVLFFILKDIFLPLSISRLHGTDQ